MLKPKEAGDPSLPDEVGMDDILRSIQDILGDVPESPVTFPEPDASANDAAPAADVRTEKKAPPLSFLQRRRPPETIEPVLTTPAMPSLEERLERHRAKAEAERIALRALAERASAKVRGTPDVEPPTPEPEATREPEGTLEAEPDPVLVELDIFAEGEDPVEETARARRARRMPLPRIDAEEVDYSGPQSSPRVEIMPAEPVETEALDRTFEDIARSMLSDRADDMDTILTDMMRPLVREWLDDNLSGIVERVVREEIERVSRGGR